MSSAPHAPFPPVGPEQLRRAAGRFATGVAIATTLDAGRPHGLTVNSFTSVSLDPPLILFCIDKAAQGLKNFLDSNSFVINILRSSQAGLSTRFAQKIGDRFEGLEWTRSGTGAPVLPDMLAVFECRKHRTVEAGDHWILIGEVIAAEAAEGEPLLYFASQYREVKS